MTTVIIRRRKLGMGSCKAIAEQSKEGIKVVRNWKDDFPEDTNLVIRWGCTSNVPTRNVVNTAAAIHTVGDKASFRKTLQDNHPEIVPKTWFDWEEVPNGEEVIIRSSYHAQGRNLWVTTDEDFMRDKCESMGEGNYYISSLIKKVKEYRVCFMQGRVVWVAHKTPGDPNAVAWNVAQGGRFDNVRWGEWPMASVEAARKAFLLSGLDFGGVDVMEDEEGIPYILEINSAPSLTSPYRQSCMAKGFDYIIDNGKDIIPVKEFKSWKNYIHPSLTQEAN